MKRFLILLCVLALALPFHAFAAGQPTFTPSAELSADGSTITVTVSASSASQICSGSFDIAYDSTLLKCTSVTGGSALSGATFLGNASYASDVARAGWMSLSPMKSDGPVAVFTFQVLADAAGKTIQFDLTAMSAYDEIGSSVAISSASASLSIPAGESTETPQPESPILPSPTPSTPTQPVEPPAEEEEEEEDNPEAFLMTFTDVSDTDYYYNAVQWAVKNGITTGTSDTTFSPTATCTRAQTVTFLWRAAGCPTPSNTACPFLDVNPTSYYYTAVLWAVEQGITTGTSSTTFSPDNSVTRAQTVTFLHRAAGCPAASSSSCKFQDTNISGYYYGAVLWAVEQGITTGTSSTTFSPDAPCSRGQIVTFLYRASVE